MFRFAPYVLKSLWRHRARTALTVSGTAVALFVFCVVGAVQQGLDRLTRSSHADRTLVAFQENQFCPANSRLPEDYARIIANLHGVKDVVPIQVFTNNCRASLDMVVFNGLPPGKLPAARNLELLSGTWSAYEGRADAALVGQAVARRRNLNVGQHFTVGEVTVFIAGVFASSVAAEDNFIYTHLDFLQRAPGRNVVGTVTQLEVRLDDHADSEATAATIDARFRNGPVATMTQPKGVFQREAIADLAELIGFTQWLGYACLGLVFSLVATTTVMAVQDRIREHAVLQTLGLRPMRVFRLVVAESLLQSAAGGFLGMGLGMLLLSWGSFSIGTEGVAIAFEPSLSLAFSGAVVSAAVGLLAGLAPGYQAAHTEIVTALRQA